MTIISLVYEAFERIIGEEGLDQYVKA